VETLQLYLIFFNTIPKKTLNFYIVLDSSVRISTLRKKQMTLPSQAKKLNQNEIYSITNAVREAGIQQIHPEKMEAFAEYLVSKVKEQGKD